MTMMGLGRYEAKSMLTLMCLSFMIIMNLLLVTPEIITIAKYYFFENKMIEPDLILELRVNW